MATHLATLGKVLLIATLAYSWPLPEDNEVGDSSPINIDSLGDKIFGQPKESSGDKLKSWNPKTALNNAEEIGEYAEGDILFPPESKRNGIRAETYRWPNGIMPYVIEANFSPKDKEMFMKAVADFHRLTCVRLVPRSAQHKNYVAITNKASGCWSSVGMIGGRQEVNLQSPGCLTIVGTPIHELLHAFGFFHEQSRPERDNHVTVFLQNVKPSETHNFNKQPKDTVIDYNIPYDTRSVMHYSEFAFSTNGQKTIAPKVGGVTLGQRQGFSRGDIQKINAMYKCTKESNNNNWLASIFG